MKKIQVYVMHTPGKDDATVKSPIYQNIIGGGAFYDGTIPEGWITDNSGDNISLKNRFYCELTAQYWAWKNSTAEYVGLCHYRRFLSLSGMEFETEDPRGQVQARILDDRTAHYYHLDDTKAMERLISQYDLILPRKQNLAVMQTPIGPQKTVYKHFAGHDRMFMNKSDLDVMLDLIKKHQPAYYEGAKKYLNQNTFWGFNCFVMKKELLNEMCEFEFSILEEAEKVINTEKYNQQQSRYAGFLAEMLSCIFFDHIISTRKDLKVKEVQLIYFENTQRQHELPLFRQDAVPIVINVERVPSCLLLPALESLLENRDPASVYDIIILHWDMESSYIKYYAKYAENNENCRISFVNQSLIQKSYEETDRYAVDPRIVLPWILGNYSRIYVFNWNTEFITDIHKYIKAVDVEDCSIASNLHTLMVGRANDISPKYENHILKELSIKDKYMLLNENAYMMNLAWIRKHLQRKDIMRHFRNLKTKAIFGEELNMVYQESGKIVKAPVYYYTNDTEEARIMKQAPLSAYQEYIAAEKEPSLITYFPFAMWRLDASDFSRHYWDRIRTSDFYYLFLGRISFENGAGGGESSSRPKLSNIVGCIKDNGFAYTVKYAASFIK